MLPHVQNYELGFATRNRDVFIADSRANSYCINGRYASPAHVHGGFFDLALVVDGRRHETINGQAVTYEPGDLFLIREGDWHEGHGDPVWFFMICGRLSWLEPVMDFAQIMEAYQALCRMDHTPCARIPRRQLGDIADEWEHCWKIQDTPLRAGHIISLTLRLFTTYLLPLVEETLPRRLFPAWFRKGMDYIHAHVGEDIPSEELADVCDKSPEHVCRSFQTYLGTTPSQYINRTRLDYAARLLNTTSLPILEISMQAGFNNLGYFYALFRKRFDMSPRRYRLLLQMQGTQQHDPVATRRHS